MQGRRIYPTDDDSRFASGDYGRYHNIWFACTPNNELGNLAEHNVTEHEDGTITVSPSILVSDGQRELWHGYLERGVWREV